MEEPKMNENKIYDVVIVGAGVAGALVAYELVKAGKSVLMLEAGPDKTALKDRNLLVENYYKSFPKTPESPYPVVPPAHKATTAALFSCPYDGYLVQKDCYKEIIPDNARNNWFKSTYERRVGGTTWHWLGTSLRYVPTDFKMKSTYPNLPAGFADWPIDYWDLYPWYERAEAEIGVSGNSNYDLGAPRKDPQTGRVAQFPMPEIPMSYLDLKVAKAVDGQTVPIPGYEGFKIEVRPTPQARNSVAGYQQRPQCCGNSSCIPICPIHAKYDASVHVNLAKNNYGKLFTLQAQSVAYKVDVDKETGNISGVRYKKWEKKGNDYPYTEQVAKGRIYVIAAHAVESPKLLQISATNELPYGVSNSSKRVGKYLMDHNTQLSFALAEEQLFPFRGPLSTSGVESLKDNKARGTAGAFRIEIGNDAWEWPEDAPYQQVQGLVEGWQLRWDNENEQMVKQQVKPKFGKELAENLRQMANREIRLAALVEPTPMINHFVAPSNKNDVLGIPRPYMQYGITDDPYCVNGMKNAIQVHDQILKSLGAKEVYHKPVEQFAGAGHIMGTCRMGIDPGESVIDKYQRSHDHKNMFIVGSSIFPTVGASNPTLTIAALSLWAADSINKQLNGM